VSSGDDLREERRALQEAREAVGLFDVLEQQCANAADQLEADLGPMRSAVVKKLEKAEALLGEGSDSAAIYRLILQNRMHIALVAQALKDRFGLGSAGGPGGASFSISERPHVKWLTGTD
jgi:hypothetical protein